MTLSIAGEEFKEGITAPQIKRIPGKFESAEFGFKEILFEMVELEVNTQCWMYINIAIANAVHKLYRFMKTHQNMTEKYFA